MTDVTALPLRRRLLLLSFLSVVGCIAFVPFISAASRAPAGAFFIPMGVAALISVLAAFLGLRFADSANLPMPWLRAFERGERPVESSTQGIRDAVVLGGLLGLIGVAAVRAFDLPENPGTLGARLLSTLFAAVTLEVILHLLIMSAVTRWTGRSWAGIAASTVAYVLFHASGAMALPMTALICIIGVHVAAGVTFGWLYARRGFEYLVLGHAVAHAIALAVN